MSSVQPALRCRSSAFAHYEPSTAPLAVNHQGQFPAVTFSFNLAPGVALGDAVDAIEQAAREIGLPASIHGSFQGTAQAFQDSLANRAAADPRRAGRPSISCSAFCTKATSIRSRFSPRCRRPGWARCSRCCCCGTDLSIIALIGIILLIGIVKKNAIMMIDFALEAERNEGKDSA